MSTSHYKGPGQRRCEGEGGPLEGALSPRLRRDCRRRGFASVIRPRCASPTGSTPAPPRRSSEVLGLGTPPAPGRERGPQTRLAVRDGHLVGVPVGTAVNARPGRGHLEGSHRPDRSSRPPALGAVVPVRDDNRASDRRAVSPACAGPGSRRRSGPGPGERRGAVRAYDGDNPEVARQAPGRADSNSRPCEPPTRAAASRPRPTIPTKALDGFVAALHRSPRGTQPPALLFGPLSQGRTA